MVYDAAIIGTGPAGMSAALNLKIHEKNFIWIGSRDLSDRVAKAEQVSNYPGFSKVSGRELNEAFQKQIREMEIEITEQMVNSIIKFGESYALMAGSEFYQAKTLILATGIANVGTLPGEQEYVGKGVSYCATCDGGLYKGKKIAVICNSQRFEHEVKYLAGLAEKVYYFPQYPNADIPAENVERMAERAAGVEGKERIQGIRLKDGSLLPVDGLFCLRDSIALSALLPELEREDGHIRVNRRMETNLPGVYAAGDCTGRPYQYTKAVGEGNVAAHSLLSYLQ